LPEQIEPCGAQVPGQHCPSTAPQHRPSPQDDSPGSHLAVPAPQECPSAAQLPSGQQTGVGAWQIVPSPQQDCPVPRHTPAQHSWSIEQHEVPHRVWPMKHSGWQSRLSAAQEPSPQQLAMLVGQQPSGPQPGPAWLPLPHWPQVASPAAQQAPRRKLGAVAGQH
jgi:hypothetical protein